MTPRHDTIAGTRFTPTGAALDDLVAMLRGKSVLITGGTGSFGKAFARTVLDIAEPARVIIFSRDELKQYDMRQSKPFRDCDPLRFFIGDVRDEERLDIAMRDVDYVIHAAAMKQVDTAEYNPFECIKTNVLGAENIVRAALRNHVSRVIALSTDKAVNPINLYGASKLASDKIFVAANSLAGSLDTRFAVVRYGNVVGSRGSVVPVFKRLLAEGVDALPITDPRMTRFWITLDQGVGFVLSSLRSMTGGEIFVPKIPSMKVSDLATAMAPHLPHRVIGIRPGEKLHEAMITEGDARTTVELEGCYVILPAFAPWRAERIELPGAVEVAEDFRYTSDHNTEWLDSDGMRRLIDSGMGA